MEKLGIFIVLVSLFAVLFISACVDIPLACTKELKICPDGSGVGRNSSNNCEFDPCPNNSGSEQCTADAKICPDGTSVGRNPNNDCQFNPCPV